MNITPIGHIRSPFKQKFAIPRQPGLVKAARGEVVLTRDAADANCLRGIEQFSHLWLLFHFHETADKGWSPTVQPPRLGGKEKVGVFASRSTFRPNGLGMSVVENRGWRQQGSEVILAVAGLDLLDGTPILDIKPYLPYADSIAGATGGYAETAPGNAFAVHFSEEAENMLQVFSGQYPELRELITTVLEQDPRPAWRHREPDPKQYGMSLFDLNIKWRIEDKTISVIRIEKSGDAD